MPKFFLPIKHSILFPVAVEGYRPIPVVLFLPRLCIFTLFSSLNIYEIFATGTGHKATINQS
jgi:hypothetical protein